MLGGFRVHIFLGKCVCLVSLCCINNSLTVYPQSLLSLLLTNGALDCSPDVGSYQLRSRLGLGQRHLGETGQRLPFSRRAFFKGIFEGPLPKSVVLNTFAVYDKSVLDKYKGNHKEIQVWFDKLIPITQEGIKTSSHLVTHNICPVILKEVFVKALPYRFVMGEHSFLP